MYPDYQKDPKTTTTYTMPWARELDGQTIETSEWTGALVQSSAIDGSKTKVAVTGGSDGSAYELTNTITTSGGETRQKTLVIAVRNQ